MRSLCVNLAQNELHHKFQYWFRQPFMETFHERSEGKGEQKLILALPNRRDGHPDARDEMRLNIDRLDGRT